MSFRAPVWLPAQLQTLLEIRTLPTVSCTLVRLHIGCSSGAVFRTSIEPVEQQVQQLFWLCRGDNTDTGIAPALQLPQRASLRAAHRTRRLGDRLS